MPKLKSIWSMLPDFLDDLRGRLFLHPALAFWGNALSDYDCERTRSRRTFSRQPKARA
jgi:hypothetical protein